MGSELVTRTLLLLPAMAWATAPGCWVPVDPAAGAALDVSQASIIDGSSTQDFPAVGALLIDEGAGLCTATLVAGDAVLTAAHCAEMGNEAHEDFFFLGSSLWDWGDEFRVVDAVVHPEYDPEEPAHDVALLFLDGLPDVTPMALNDRRMDSTWEGQLALLVGFGTTDSYYGNTSGEKRQATAEIHDVYGDKMYHRSDEHGICSGDSGGPALMLHGGEWILLGAASYVFPLGGGQDPCEGQGVHMRVDAHLEWLGEHIDAPELAPEEEWSPDGDGEIDACLCRVGSPPQPGIPLALPALAALAWLRRRDR